MILGKVKFTGKGGYRLENEKANSILVVGQEYDCDDVEMESFSSRYHLFDLGWFNTVMFEDSEIFDNAAEQYRREYYGS